MLATLRRQGLAAACHQIGLKLVNRALPFKVLRGVHVATPDPGFLACPGRYAGAFLTPDALRRFAEDPATEMSPAFVEEALAGGDRCYAMLDGENLAAYGWYSARPTPVDSPRLMLHFAAGYVYMYKGFTDPRHRGQRLHAIGMTRALRHYRSRGYKGIVSYVESANFDSLKSCLRMGYEVFGSVYLVRLFGRDFAFSTPGCAAFEFSVQTAN